MANNDLHDAITELKKINERLAEQEIRLRNLEEDLNEALLPEPVRKVHLRSWRMKRLISGSFLLLVSLVLAYFWAGEPERLLFAALSLAWGLFVLLVTPEKEIEWLKFDRKQ